jgi:hypothetical protein
MDSSATEYIPSFIKIGPGIQNLMRVGGFTDTQTEWLYHKPILEKSAKIFLSSRYNFAEKYLEICLETCSFLCKILRFYGGED